MRVLPGMMVMGHFENWNFTTDHITFLGEKRKYMISFVRPIREYFLLWEIKLGV
jgi:hypothetical protein